MLSIASATINTTVDQNSVTPQKADSDLNMVDTEKCAATDIVLSEDGQRSTQETEMRIKPAEALFGEGPGQASVENNVDPD